MRKNHFDVCISLAAFLRLELGEEVELLGRAFLARSIGMLVGPRGCGKSMLAMLIAYAIAGGKTLPPWGQGAGVDVTYVDGEMRVRGFRERLEQLHWSNTNPATVKLVEEHLYIISRDLCGTPIGYLDTKEGRDAFDEAIPGTCQFLVLDNLSALTSGGREDAASWAEIKQWLIQKRLDGIAVLIIHHAGKNGSQRGSSAHEDLLDYVIQLSPEDDSEKTAFTLRYTKLRDHIPELKQEFLGSFWPEEKAKRDSLGFEIAPKVANVNQRDVEMVAMRKEGKSIEQIGLHFGLHKSTISRRLKALGTEPDADASLTA
jgi:KaiC/GvpD/RAD55 family RecA-like ATPase